MLYTQGKIQCNPAEVGYDEKRLEVLNNHFQRAIDEKEIQCAMYCLSRKGKVFAHGALGKKSFRDDNTEAAQPDSVRWIASITKIFAAVAIMKLVEDGLTRLDVPVGEILPQFNTPPYNGITLFHLLTHSSGMHADGGCYENQHQTNYWAMIDKAYKLHKLENKSDEEFDWIAASLSTIGSGLHVKTGSQWAYCSFGFVIIGAVIEKLTGIHANKYVEDFICKPLGMKDTAFDLTPETAKRCIIGDEDGETYTQDVINGTQKPGWIGDILNLPSLGGGLLSTASDLVKFGNMILHKGTFDNVRILGRKAVEKATKTNVSLPDFCWNAGGGIRNYGVGFDRRNGPQFTFSDSAFMHEGAGACALYIDPDEELVASWIVPYVNGDGWYPRVMYNPQNIIWSGLL
ncbi:MAG: beta-lactamase family protein [Oscillospiraceae bacterium]|nr:beta-lactamase family protein [Oscillospiraceae bacterium]